MFLLTSAVVAEDHQIVLTRRAHTGDRYQVVCDATQATRTIWTVDGSRMPATNEVDVWHYFAVVEVVAASALGTENQARITVNELTSMKRIDGRDGEKSDLLPAGTVIEAVWRDGSTHFTIAGEPPAAALALVLSRLVHLESPAISLDEAIFGTDQRQQAGASWPVDAKAAAQDMTIRMKSPTKAEAISGSSKLVEVVPDGLKITSELTAVGVQFPLQPWMTISNSRLRFEGSGVFPIDHDRRPPRRSVLSVLTVTGTGDQDGKSYILDYTYRLFADYIMSPLP
ncbi:MAG: hypothetical protein H0W78_13545 [Planctomycetes bacterium]|jgi:hypothetical protein|nr:hypothetical protein [Planctomycetota bacterium]